MRFGITYLDHEVLKRGLNPDQALHAIAELGIDTVRVGAYWNQIQPQPDTWDFDALDRILNHLQSQKLDVVLTVGMKAPRWPEFYMPDWLPSHAPDYVGGYAREFITQVVNRYKGLSVIQVWQVENEPLDVGGKLKTAIPLYVLASEINLVRQLDPKRPIHLNFWGNNIIRRADYQEASQLADVIGIDLYYRQPAKWFGYHGPYFFDWQLKRWIASQPKPVWITELQGDAWEKNHNHKWQANPGSMSPYHLQQSFKRAISLNPEAVLFWGYEYWLWHKQQGRPELWETAIKLLNNRGS